MIADGGLADISIILLALASAGCVDHQRHVTGFDAVNQIGATEAEFLNQLGLDAVFLQKGMRTACGLDAEAHLFEQSGRF